MKLGVLIALIILGVSTTARAQAAQQICVPITTNASGVSVTSCVPVGTNNPFPTQAQ